MEKEFHFRVYGKNIIPTHAEIPSFLDAVHLLEKQDELRIFEQNSAMLLQEFACLREWICKNPSPVVSIGRNCRSVLQVLLWFSRNKQRDLYLRQLDIEGVDTKFIESHSGLLKQLLDVVLPLSQINTDSNNFEKRYGLKSRPTLLRFRILDERIAIYSGFRRRKFSTGATLTRMGSIF